MDHFGLVQMSQAAQDAFRDVTDPVLFQRATARTLQEVSDGTGATVLHHQPQLIIVAWARFLDKGAEIRGNVCVVRVFLDLKILVWIKIEIN